MIVGPSLLWYLTRATGATALVLLTASVILGVAAVGRVQTVRMPRFVVNGLHRTVSLLAIALLLVHIITAVLDTFAPISLRDAVIPFGAAYRPLWLGLGAAAFDLLLVVALTSLVRRRLGHGTWRGVHWLSYAAWPVAVLHGFGTGSDADRPWMLALSIACVAAVIAGIVARAMIGWPANAPVRLGALGGAAAFALALVIWLPRGPLAAGWARRAGTPPALLSSAHSHGGRA